MVSYDPYKDATMAVLENGDHHKITRDPKTMATDDVDKNVVDDSRLGKSSVESSLLPTFENWYAPYGLCHQTRGAFSQPWHDPLLDIDHVCVARERHW
jgi:hypothetical protein